MKSTNNRPTAKICFNGIKFFNSDGSRSKVPFMLRWAGDLKFLEKENYNIIYA